MRCHYARRRKLFQIGIPDYEFFLYPGNVRLQGRSDRQKRQFQCTALLKWLRRALLLEKRFSALFHLIRRDVFFVRRDRPYMSKRILQRARPVAVELIL